MATVNADEIPRQVFGRTALTPTGSRTNLSSLSADPSSPRPRRHATTQSPLFQLLPPEIRSQILIAAFGNRTLHMDLVFGHRPLPYLPSHRPAAFLGHAGIYVEPSKTSDNRLYPLLDVAGEHSTYWLGSVCHRNPPGVDDSTSHGVQPYQDQCRDGITFNNNCSLWPGQSPNKCRIGAMGWLKTCWQAYVEGIPVLYGQNTIHMCSKLLILTVNKAILPQRLLAITSLELSWDFESGPPWAEIFPSKAGREMYDFEMMLRIVPQSFRSLKKLYISVQWTRRGWLPTLDRGVSLIKNASAETMLMQPVDGMVQRFRRRVTMFALAIPSSMYHDQCYQVKQRANGIVEHVSAGAAQERFWRPIVNGAAHSGYWVYMGQREE